MTHTTTAPVLLIKVGENVLVRTTEDWQESNLKALRARFGAKRVQPLAVSTFDAAEAGARGIAVYRNKDAYMRAENANDAVEAALLPTSTSTTCSPLATTTRQSRRSTRDSPPEPPTPRGASGNQRAPRRWPDASSALNQGEVMKKYTIQVLLNVAERPGVMLDGWQQGDEIATYDHDLLVIAGDPYAAAEKVFAIGNRQGEDMTGRIWASDIRSLSVGDVLLITDAEHWRRPRRSLSRAWAGSRSRTTPCSARSWTSEARAQPRACPSSVH